MFVFQLIPLVFVAFGVLFAVLGVRNQRSNLRFTRSASQASAQVTDLRMRSIGPRSDSSIAYFPVVRFDLPDGRTVEAETSTGTSWSRPKPGTPVEVLYDPQNPADVRIAGKVGGALMNGFMIVFGVIFALFGLAFLVVFQAFADTLP